MTALSEMGAIIAPPVPPFYAKPQTLDDVVDLTIGRVLDFFAIDGPPLREDAGVDGGSSQIWNVANYGSVEGLSVGIDLESSGSTLTNWGAISGTGAGGVGVLLPKGGSVTNQSSGSVSGYVGVIVGGSGAVTNAGSISAGMTAVFVASGSVDNESGGTLRMTSSEVSNVTVYVGGGGLVTNAGTITNAGYNTAAVVIGDSGRVTNSGRISTTGALDQAIYMPKGEA